MPKGNAGAVERLCRSELGQTRSRVGRSRTDLPAAIAMLREHERLVEGMEHEAECLAISPDIPGFGAAGFRLAVPEPDRCNCIRGRLLAVGGKS